MLNRNNINNLRYGNYKKVLKIYYIKTRLGVMLAIADNNSLYMLDFIDAKNLGNKILQIYTEIKPIISAGQNKIILSIEKELKLYFKGKLKVFRTPVSLLGGGFEKLVWRRLRDIPYGETRSYLDQAKIVGSSKGFRAIGKANSHNRLVIILPCHRVIRSNGELSGYGGGLKRKQWLINHEKRFY